MSQDKADFTLGQYVFAKVPGYYHWPAIVSKAIQFCIAEICFQLTLNLAISIVCFATKLNTDSIYLFILLDNELNWTWSISSSLLWNGREWISQARFDFAV